MKIVLVRHAQTTIEPKVNSMQWTLSDEGRQAAGTLAKSSIFKGTEAIYSSLQPKAIETAKIIGDALQFTVAQEEGLAELTSVTNGFIDDYSRTVHRLYKGEINNINSGESLEQALGRFNRAIEVIAAKNVYADKIVVVSHANVLSLFSAQYSDSEAIDLHNSITMPDAAVLNWNGSDSTFDKFWGSAA